MIKTEICKGDKVVIRRGAGRHIRDEKTKAQVLCAVLRVDRIKGRVLLEVPRPKTKRGERETPQKGVEQWKSVRYNPKSGEPGGLKIAKKSIHISNVTLVEKGPRREAKA